MSKDIWMPLPGYELLYNISNTGKIWRKVDHKIFFGTKNVQGYLYITLRISTGKRKNFLMHRLIASAFIPNPENKPFINHKNGVRSDNRIENLEWSTPLENIAHALETKLIKRLKVYDLGLAIKMRDDGKTFREISNHFKCSIQSVRSSIIRAKNRAKLLPSPPNTSHQ